MANFASFSNFSNLCPPKWLKITRNDQISPNLQLFHSFPTEVIQNDSEWPITPDLQLFQSFSTKVAQNDSEWPILTNLQLSNLSPPKWLRLTRNDKFHLICNFSNNFPTKVAQNDSEWPILPQLATFPIFSHRSGSE